MVHCTPAKAFQLSLQRLGAIKHGGLELPSQVAGWLDLAASRRQSAVLGFIDIRAVYYRAWSEHALGLLNGSGIPARVAR